MVWVVEGNEVMFTATQPFGVADILNVFPAQMLATLAPHLMLQKISARK